MISKISLTFACAVVATFLSLPSFAAGKTNSTNTATVTGCLVQGDEANEYAVRSEDGKTYGLKSSTVNLAQHMNHKVTVTGTVKPTKEKAKTSSNGKPEEDFHMRVSDLKMVSSTCQ
jgi:hypothetical protein